MSRRTPGRLGCSRISRHPSASLLCLLLLCWLLGLCESFAQSKGEEAIPSPTEKVLASAQSAALERRYSEAIKILRTALREYPGDTTLQLELGRAYLAIGEDDKAGRLFSEILAKEPGNRPAQLELARTLAYQRNYDRSDRLYRQLLALNPADEAAAIGLTSNLIHEGRSSEAAATDGAALRLHPTSLRLLEFKDRIAEGLLGGDVRPLPVTPNSLSTSMDYINDSAGNHSWRGTERLEYRIKPGLTSDLHLEQEFLHSLDDSREVVETFSEMLRWRPTERLGFAAGGGGIRFDKGDVRAIRGHADRAACRPS